MVETLLLYQIFNCNQHLSLITKLEGYPEPYPEPSQILKMERFVKVAVNYYLTVNC